MSDSARLFWVATLWIAWSISGVHLSLLILTLNLTTVWLAGRPTRYECLVYIYVVIVFAAQFAGILLLAVLLSIDASYRSCVLIETTLRFAVVSLVLPLFLRGAILDDVLILLVRARWFAVGKGKISLRVLPFSVLGPIVAMLAPVLQAPLELRATHESLILRGILPTTAGRRFMVLLRRPGFFIWAAHVEPLIIRSLERIPALFDSLALKGLHREDRAAIAAPRLARSDMLWLIAGLGNLGAWLFL